MRDEGDAKQYYGKWVARKFVTHEIVLAADSPQELEASIRAEGLRNVAVMRIPTEDEPLFVGPG